MLEAVADLLRLRGAFRVAPENQSLSDFAVQLVLALGLVVIRYAPFLYHLVLGLARKSQMLKQDWLFDGFYAHVEVREAGNLIPVTPRSKASTYCTAARLRRSRSGCFAKARMNAVSSSISMRLPGTDVTGLSGRNDSKKIMLGRAWSDIKNQVWFEMTHARVCD